jgi:hypothetical protein
MLGTYSAKNVLVHYYFSSFYLMGAQVYDLFVPCPGFV